MGRLSEGVAPASKPALYVSEEGSPATICDTRIGHETRRAWIRGRSGRYTGPLGTVDQRRDIALRTLDRAVCRHGGGFSVWRDE